MNRAQFVDAAASMELLPNDLNVLVSMMILCKKTQWAIK